VIVPLLLLVHAVDLGIHDRRFILRGSISMRANEAEIITRMLRKVGDGRVAIDYALSLPMDRTVDDLGFFDSIMLARPYRMILSLSGAPRDLNIQTLNGSEIPSRALAAAGVKFAVTTTKRKDLQNEAQIHGLNIYSISSPSRRAEFFNADQIQYLSTDEIHAKLRDPEFDLRSVLLLPHDSRPTEGRAVTAKSNGTSTVEYRRPDSDHIECTVTTERNGYLRIIESWDPGWSATMDGLTVPIVPALDALLAVPISPGRHEVRFTYRTPGTSLGRTISIISLVLLCGLIWISGWKQQRQR